MHRQRAPRRSEVLLWRLLLYVSVAHTVFLRAAVICCCRSHVIRLIKLELENNWFTAVPVLTRNKKNPIWKNVKSNLHLIGLTRTITKENDFGVYEIGFGSKSNLGVDPT